MTPSRLRARLAPALALTLAGCGAPAPAAPDAAPDTSAVDALAITDAPATDAMDAMDARGPTDVGALDAPAPGLDAARDVAPRPPRPMTLLQANVGNVALTCNGPYIYKLCAVDVEARIASAIAGYAPDVVALQEVVASWQCDAFTETNTARVCHPDHRRVVPDQVRRLVGRGYTIACAARKSFDCVAVSTSFGEIAGCPRGELCLTGARTAPAGTGCDDGFTVSSVAITPDGGEPFTLVNAHPPSGNAVACRDDQLARVFEGRDGAAPLVSPTRSMLSGDFNMDPFRDNDAAVMRWNRFVGAGRRFAYHSGPAEHEPPYTTSFTTISRRVFDHVVSDFARGTCSTLGEAPSTARLDGGGGTDHRALLCRLEVP